MTFSYELANYILFLHTPAFVASLFVATVPGTRMFLIGNLRRE
jgi:hypothetical protein